jgi:hypothetical protein
MNWRDFKSQYVTPAHVQDYIAHYATTQDHDVTFCHVFRAPLDSHGISAEEAYRLRKSFLLMDEYLDALDDAPNAPTPLPTTNTPPAPEDAAPEDSREVALANYRQIFTDAMRANAFAPAVAAQNAINKLLGLAVDDESGSMEGMTLPFEKMSLADMNKEIQRMEEVLEQFNAIRVGHTAADVAKEPEGTNLDSGAFGGGAEAAPAS